MIKVIMPISGTPQLIVGPYDSSSLIFSDSSFESAKITLNDGLIITGTDPDSINTLGGILAAGPVHVSSSIDVSFDGGITGALVVDGGVYIEEKLFVNDSICLTGDLEVGTTGGESSSSIYLGAKDDPDSWKFTRESGVLSTYKHIDGIYKLMSALSVSTC